MTLLIAFSEYVPRSLGALGWLQHGVLWFDCAPPRPANPAPCLGFVFVFLMCKQEAANGSSGTCCVQVLNTHRFFKSAHVGWRVRCAATEEISNQAPICFYWLVHRQDRPKMNSYRKERLSAKRLQINLAAPDIERQTITWIAGPPSSRRFYFTWGSMASTWVIAKLKGYPESWSCHRQSTVKGDIANKNDDDDVYS